VNDIKPRRYTITDLSMLPTPDDRGSLCLFSDYERLRRAAIAIVSHLLIVHEHRPGTAETKNIAESMLNGALMED
jgi:hypothetical protein